MSGQRTACAATQGAINIVNEHLVIHNLHWSFFTSFQLCKFQYYIYRSETSIHRMASTTLLLIRFSIVIIVLFVLYCSLIFIDTSASNPPLDSLEKKMFSDLKDCPTRPQVPFVSQRGDFWILENYIPAAMGFRCDESVTYTTHGDYTFLDNLDTLTSRWQVR